MLLLGATAALAQPNPLAVFLARTVAEFPGKAGIWVKHLSTGQTGGIQDTELFNSASVIKMPVLVLAFQMADRGEISARATGQMLEAIEKKTIASPASCDAMLRMLRAQQAGQRRLNHYLSVPVAHKTGDFPPVLANDVGIIYARSGPIVVSFLGNAITGNYGEAEDRIGRFAQQLVGYFDK